MGSGMAFAAGVTSGAKAVAGCSTIGGSRPVKNLGVQLFHKGSTSKTFDGKAMMGR